MGEVQSLLGAIEGGGSKFLCALGTGYQSIIARTQISTGDPETTLVQVCDFFESQSSKPAAVGLALFGPVDVRGQISGVPGTLLHTPKPGWSGFGFGGRLQNALGCPVRVDTDVNAAVLAETKFGNAKAQDPAVYITVGTGIGGGVFCNGRTIQGAMHPELGHLPAPTLCFPNGRVDDFPGSCPFHGRCFEGVASGSAIQARFGKDPCQVDDDDFWQLHAHYLAHLINAVILMISPQKVVLGGGIARAHPSLDPIKHQLALLLGDYGAAMDLDGLLVRPAFEYDAGLVGGFILAQAAQGGEVAP